MPNTFTFTSKLFRWSSAKASWYFITLPVEVAAEINDRYAHLKAGWGSLPVQVQIGKSSWKTSIFPDKKSNSFLLPIKAAVRKNENLLEKNNYQVTLTVLA